MYSRKEWNVVLTSAEPTVKFPPEPPTLGSMAFPEHDNSFKVLLIEDNAIDAGLIRAALADNGRIPAEDPLFYLESVGRLGDGLKRLGSKRDIDVVLLDLSLPDSHGLETVVATRAQSPNVPIVVMTGLDDEALAVSTLRQGAQDYLVKSHADRRTLIRAIRHAIERKRAQEALRESEEKFRSIVETTNEWIWSIDLQGELTYTNPAITTILGYSPDDLLGRCWALLMHESDRQLLLTRLAEAVVQKTGWSGLVMRWKHKNGTYRHLESNALPILDSTGNLLGYRGSDRDITEQEQAKQERRQLQLRLVTLQEEERHRLSRELHDQMGQSLAALMLGLKSLENVDPHQHSGELGFHHLHELANQLAQQVHTVATDLRPTALDDLGLETALSNYLEEWSERCRIHADLHSAGLNERLPTHIETTVYRIVQEALTNVHKHSNACNVSVIVEQRDNGLQAIIEDNGRGFDAEALIRAPVKDRRLGLLGMQERIALVGGSLNIESTPGFGTTLFVRIPASGSNQEAA
jgi:PAS domain S-box-containing protein